MKHGIGARAPVAVPDRTALARWREIVEGDAAPPLACAGWSRVWQVQPLTAHVPAPGEAGQARETRGGVATHGAVPHVVVPHVVVPHVVVPRGAAARLTSEASEAGSSWVTAPAPIAVMVRTPTATRLRARFESLANAAASPNAAANASALGWARGVRVSLGGSSGASGGGYFFEQVVWLHLPVMPAALVEQGVSGRELGSLVLQVAGEGDEGEFEVRVPLVAP